MGQNSHICCCLQFSIVYILYSCRSALFSKNLFKKKKGTEFSRSLLNKALGLYLNQRLRMFNRYLNFGPVLFVLGLFFLDQSSCFFNTWLNSIKQFLSSCKQRLPLHCWHFHGRLLLGSVHRFFSILAFCLFSISPVLIDLQMCHLSEHTNTITFYSFIDFSCKIFFFFFFFIKKLTEFWMCCSHWWVASQTIKIQPQNYTVLEATK